MDAFLVIGAVEREVLRVGRRCAHVLRAVVVVCVSGVGLVQAPEKSTMWVVTAMVGWGGLAAVLGSRPWALWADTAIVAGVCLTQPWTVAAVGSSTNWVLAIVSITAVVRQWDVGVSAGAVVTAAVVLGYLAGA
jgi:hypothetical protein